MKSKLSSLLPLVTFVFFLTTLTGSAFAGELELKMIGSMATQGKTYSEWWYSLTNPKLSGTTADYADVKITAGTTEFDETADANGNWEVLIPLPAGDHNIKIEADGETYAFILHLGQTMPTSTTTTSTTTSTTTTPVPSTGLDQTVAISLALGLTFLASYLYFFGEKSHIINFEKEIKNH